ncbi:uncharacterized protein isoform X2 [Musca autumnalis]|uniref:uncharacterized protein isoform X2 n=1 Tax=Musca autumnalis TaxID=221902 RepID=UPI003CF715C9
MEAFNGNNFARENDYSSSSDVEELQGFVKYAVSPFSISSSDETTKKFTSTRKRNGEERMPTRRPDPKVYNRNALLARENRRKKKLYLESLEREIQEARLANKNLVKALKRQISISKQMEQQAKYYQNIIANKAEIANLLSILENKKATKNDNIHQEQCSSSCSYDHRPSTDLELDNDINDCRSSLDDILWNNNCAETSSEATLSSSETSNVMDDHTYIASSSEAQSSPDFSTTYADFNWNEDFGFLTSTTSASCIHINRGHMHLLGCAY